MYILLLGVFNYFQVVIRRLPPTLTEDQLREDLGGFPEHDFFYFVGGDMRYMSVASVFCRMC